MSGYQDAYDTSAWNRPGPGGGTRGAGGPFLGQARSFLDGLPRPVAIALIVATFVLWWPVGLATLAYMAGTGRLGARWRRANEARGCAPWNTWSAWTSGGRAGSSGNHAFDEYREQTLRRLEEEQQEFASFLERLRFAKDKAEFDQFMAERRARPTQAEEKDNQA